MVADLFLMDRYTTTQEFRHLTFSKQVFQDIVLPMTELENALVRRHGPTAPPSATAGRTLRHSRTASLRAHKAEARAAVVVEDRTSRTNSLASCLC